MIRLVLVLVAGAAVAAGCADGDSSRPQASAPSQAQEDRKDTKAIEGQVNKQVSDRALNEATAQGDFVDTRSDCTKQSDTAYKCITIFTSPTGFPEVVTEVTCDRNGGSCISETR